MHIYHAYNLFTFISIIFPKSDQIISYSPLLESFFYSENPAVLYIILTLKAILL